MRPRTTWFLFGTALAVALAAMTWISLAAVRAEQAEQAIRELADHEEQVRLTLAHMDSLCTPLVAQESAHPYFWFQAVYAVGEPAPLDASPLEAGPYDPAGLAVSPLVEGTSPLVWLHFQVQPSGEVHSPSVPTPAERACLALEHGAAGGEPAAAARLAELRDRLDVAALQAALPAIGLEAYWAQTVAMQDLEQQEQQISQPASAPQEQTLRDGPPQAADDRLGEPSERLLAEARQRQSSLNYRAAVQRNESLRNSLKLQIEANPYSKNAAQTLGQPPRTGSAAVEQGPMVALWQNGLLLLARRVRQQDRQYLQGCWLNWPAIQAQLLSDLPDALAGAELVPLAADAAGQWPRRLAALPVALAAVPLPVRGNPAWSPVRQALLVAWSCAALAAAAVALLLGGAMALSERRARFVSAVTHELRTPLTTLRMYAEMLAERMIDRPEQRQLYLDTLRGEADRLAHLVENVLAWSRLERTGRRAAVEPVPAAEFLRRAEPLLHRRAREAEMTLEVDLSAEAAQAALAVDAGAAEQILLNLVDNACKYARQAADPRIRLAVTCTARQVCLAVRDWGPGIPPREARRLFRPFSKSDRQAAQSAPGVGLGLALCRQLARQMGGQLEFDARVTDGAAFVLRLPRAADMPPAARPAGL